MPVRSGDPREESVGDVVSRAISDGVARLRRNDAAFREAPQDAVEAVHQMRVATRRLRSDMRTFRVVLSRRWVEDLREELNWLADLLGAMRDADVLWQRLTASFPELSSAGARGTGELTAALDERRAHAREELLQAMNGDRYRRLIERLLHAAREPDLRSGRAARPAAGALAPLVLRAQRRLAEKVGSLAKRASDEELHAVRIAAKRCRYAAEACAPWLGEPVARLARAAKRLQTVLGELNDAVLAERWLRSWATSASGRGAAAAAELAELERARARRARERWMQAWRRVEAEMSAWEGFYR